MKSVRSGKLCMFVLGAMATAATAQSPQMVPVCDLFDGLTRWNGAMIEVTAYIEAQPSPGSAENDIWLSGRNCPSSLVVKGITFPNTINLSDPQVRATRIHAVTFEWEESSRNLLSSMLARLDRRNEYILATVIGVFETRTPLDDLVVVDRAHPKGNMMGFGLQGPHPAQILVRTIRNLRIDRKSKP